MTAIIDRHCKDVPTCHYVACRLALFALLHLREVQTFLARRLRSASVKAGHWSWREGRSRRVELWAADILWHVALWWCEAGVATGEGLSLRLAIACGEWHSRSGGDLLEGKHCRVHEGIASQ